MFKKALIIGLFLLGIEMVLFVWLAVDLDKNQQLVSPVTSSFFDLSESQSLEKRLDFEPVHQPTESVKGEKIKTSPNFRDYSFENLAQRDLPASSIEIGNQLEEETPAYYFFYQSEGKRVSGRIDLPETGKQLPVVVMLRGYVDKEIYYTGIGTKRAASYFAQNGFVCLAPDFLGFGYSDSESADILLNRFRRPVTVLNLLASIKNLNRALKRSGFSVTVNPEKIFLWGHSNGGQIAISVLEITQADYPTTLWAPVTKGFPECILQYASNLDDHGKLVIETIKNFEKTYSCKNYSITNYMDRLQAHLQVHQGTADKYIDLVDTNNFVSNAKKVVGFVSYYIYEEDGHNLRKNWDLVVERDLKFFQKYLE